MSVPSFSSHLRASAALRAECCKHPDEPLIQA
jgi:hypothetical protein